MQNCAAARAPAAAVAHDAVGDPPSFGLLKGLQKIEFSCGQTMQNCAAARAADDPARAAGGQSSFGLLKELQKIQSQILELHISFCIADNAELRRRARGGARARRVTHRARRVTHRPSASLKGSRKIQV